ncbi:TlpA family protein disulfide reductase [Halovivax cerinus]|uniref:TlpA family protein disulfide reductase n=1 Tax=Halovivax cerinus TaxID=1487865 RepID=A0ABD5NR16_9EURY|nr:TlpA disulfide reductase family protein [Halovivax cerinus]
MNRRELIAGAASLAVLGSGGAIAVGGLPSAPAGNAGSTDGGSDGDGSTSSAGSGGDGSTETGSTSSGEAGGDDAGASSYPQLREPVEIERVDLPWTEGGSLTVPIEGTVTVMEFWATWCPICADNLPAVTAAHDRVGDDVRFVSITSERVGEQVSAGEIEAWWHENGGGEWTIASDPTMRLPIRLNVPGTPSTAIADAEGTIQWTHQGAVSTERLLAKIDAAGGTVRDEKS